MLCYSRRIRAPTARKSKVDRSVPQVGGEPVDRCRTRLGESRYVGVKMPALDHYHVLRLVCAPACLHHESPDVIASCVATNHQQWAWRNARIPRSRFVHSGVAGRAQGHVIAPAAHRNGLAREIHRLLGVVDSGDRRVGTHDRLATWRCSVKLRSRVVREHFFKPLHLARQVSSAVLLEAAGSRGPVPRRRAVCDPSRPAPGHDQRHSWFPTNRPVSDPRTSAVGNDAAGPAFWPRILRPPCLPGS